MELESIIRVSLILPQPPYNLLFHPQALIDQKPSFI